MSKIRITIGTDDAMPSSWATVAQDLDFAVRLYDGSKTVGVVRLAIHFPDSGRPPQLSVYKTAAAEWLDIVDAGDVCWPPVPREKKE